MGGAYIAHFAMYATVEDRTNGKKQPCVRHPDYLYTESSRQPEVHGRKYENGFFLCNEAQS
jgi:hypothetical protein